MPHKQFHYLEALAQIQQLSIQAAFTPICCLLKASPRNEANEGGACLLLAWKAVRAMGHKKGTTFWLLAAEGRDAQPVTFLDTRSSHSSISGNHDSAVILLGLSLSSDVCRALKPAPDVPGPSAKCSVPPSFFCSWWFWPTQWLLGTSLFVGAPLAWILPGRREPGGVA